MKVGSSHDPAGGWSQRRDYYAGALMVLLGLGVGYQALGYRIGTLRQIGPGFFPLALAGVLVLVGILIAATASDSSGSDPGHADDARPEWFGWACIIAGVVAFIVLGERAGLLPATFACVFISAMGDRTATLKSTLGLTIVVTTFAVLLFSYGLKIQLPILTW